jgi:hypothetical protein
MLAMVAHPVILANGGSGGGEIRKIVVWGQSKQTVSEIPSEPWKASHGGMHLSSQLLRKVNRIEVQADPRHKKETVFEY